MDGSESSLRVVDEGGRGNERAKYVDLERQLLVTIKQTSSLHIYFTTIASARSGTA